MARSKDAFTATAHTHTQHTVTATAAIPCFSHPAAPAGFDNSRLEHRNMQLPGVSNTTESSHTLPRTHTHTYKHSYALHLHHILSLLLFCFLQLASSSFSLSHFSPQLHLYTCLTVSPNLSSLSTLVLFLSISFYSCSSCRNYLIYSPLQFPLFYSTSMCGRKGWSKRKKVVLVTSCLGQYHCFSFAPVFHFFTISC